MIDMSEWASSTSEGIGVGVLPVLLAVVGCAAACVAVAKLCHRIRHRREEGAASLLSDDEFVVTLVLAIAIGAWFATNPRYVHALSAPQTTFTEQVAEQVGLAGLSCPTIVDSDRMPPTGQVRVRVRGREREGARHEPARRIRRQDMALRRAREDSERRGKQMRGFGETMPLVADCDPVDAVECPHCSTVFRVRTLATDGAGRLMPDEYEMIPAFCPMCGGRVEQDEA